MDFSVIAIVCLLKSDVDKFSGSLSEFYELKLSKDLFLDSVASEILSAKFKEHKDIVIYKIFDKYFCVLTTTQSVDDLNKCSRADIVGTIFSKLFSLFGIKFKNVYFGFLFNDYDPSDEPFSISIRGSKTLNQTKKNTYNNPDLKVVFDNSGYCVNNYMSENKDIKNEKILMLYLLAHAYNLKFYDFINEVSISYDKGDCGIAKLKDEFYKFRLKFYFENPVKHNLVQPHSIYKVINKTYLVSENFFQTKDKILDAIDVLLDRVDKKQRQRADKNANRLEIIGILIALASLVTAVVSIFK